MNLKSNWVRRSAIFILVAAAFAAAFAGYRTYRSFQLLQSAYEAGAPRTSGIRGWMTLKYVANTYRIPEAALREGLAIAPDSDADRSLKTLADETHTSAPQYVQRVQRVIATHAPATGADREGAASGWLGAIGDQVLTGLLVYGYSALGLTLLLGTIGLPLPDGLAMALAGSLAAQGRMNWIWAGAVAVIASVAGDMVGYGIGRILSQRILDRHGHWIGYTAARRVHVHSLFERWGLLPVFITRTFVSYLSSVANLFAGVSRFGASRFLAVAIVGRLLWAAAYMGLGYLVGADLEAATSFLTNLSLLLLSLAVFAGSGLVASGRATIS